MTDNSFGKVNKFGIVEDTGYFQAIGLAYKKQTGLDSGIFGKAWAGVKSLVYGTVNYACHHPYKIAAVVGVVVVVPLMAAYFLSPAYADFVNTTAASTYAGMIAGGKGLYALAVANPVFTGLLTAAIVGVIGTFIYLNYSKANRIGEQADKIEKIKGAVLEACEKDDQGKPKLQEDGKLQKDDNKLSTCVDKIMEVLALKSTPGQQV
ncbi:MAG: hypothetical protein LBC34_00860 [Rickettsiales bacterium]|jgi:hypothetical protein|nr:hypothetical protein [Rickettsiales bacterium]